MCHERLLTKAQEELDKIRDKTTYISCDPGSHLSLQIPTEKPTSEGASHTMLDRFSVTVELKVPRLPPTGQQSALLRFSSEEFARSRSRHQASLYLTSRGLLVPHTGIPLHGAAVPIVPDQWHVVTVTVDAVLESMVVYVDGKLSMEAVGQAELHLQHRLGVLGGDVRSRAGECVYVCVACVCVKYLCDVCVFPRSSARAKILHCIYAHRWQASAGPGRGRATRDHSPGAAGRAASTGRGYGRPRSYRRLQTCAGSPSEGCRGRGEAGRGRESNY
jgi:hypothetical protein